MYLPVWMMRMLTLQDGDPIHIQGTRLPKGKFVKLQPQTVDFLEISDPKAVLEQALRNYPTLTPGDIIEISYNCLTFEILIMEIEPSAEGISIIETDLEVDFAPPKGYVEPAPKPAAPQPTMASKLHIDQDKYDSVLPGGDSATPFRGFGQTLSGKKTKGKKEKPIVPREPSSLVRSTEYVVLLTQPPYDCQQRHAPRGEARACRAALAVRPAVLWLQCRAPRRPGRHRARAAGRGRGASPRPPCLCRRRPDAPRRRQAHARGDRNRRRLAQK